MLAPAGFLVLLLLASVSVDSAIAYLGRRQLENAVAAAANDAVTVAIPDRAGDGSLQTGAEARPDTARAQQIANQEVLHPYSGGLTAQDVNAVVDGQTVTVTATGSVNYIFAKAIPGVHHAATVRARAVAVVRFR
jgi:Flp pilus assembly protein TadG